MFIIELTEVVGSNSPNKYYTLSIDVTNMLYN